MLDKLEDEKLNESVEIDGDAYIQPIQETNEQEVQLSVEVDKVEVLSSNSHLKVSQVYEDPIPFSDGEEQPLIKDEEPKDKIRVETNIPEIPNTCI